MDALIDWLLELVGALDYWGVFVLMTVESSFIPFPSELVIPPAAFLAAQGKMNLGMVILMGTLGSLAGALINYFLAYYLGKPLVYKLIKLRFARLLLLNETKLHKAENYFLRYGAISTFVGRLIPAIRQLISIPAGFVKMNLWTFSLFTSLGAGLWITVLALAGYYFGLNENLLTYYHLKFAVVVLGMVAVVMWGIWFQRKRKLKKG